SGFTLTEILIALSIFIVLGSMLVLALRSGVDTWRITEDKRLVYEQAQIILKQIEQDLVNAAIPRRGEEGEVVVRFLCDLDSNRRYRLRFVRTIKGGMADTALRTSGTGPPEEFQDVLNGKEDGEKNLQPLGGLMEVAYVMDPDPASDILYRGVRAPVGGKGSLFNDANLNSRKKVIERCTPVADGVLYLGFQFWTQYTTTWNLQTNLSESLGAECGPEVTWDSTRGVLPHPKTKAGKKNPNVFWLAAGSASEHIPADDIFPRQVQIMLCVAAGGGAPHATLTDDIDAKERTIVVDSAGSFPTEDDPDLFRYIRIGNEWVYYESRSAFSFDTRSQARGARGTKPQDHEAGEDVWGGRTFVLTAKVPAHRGYWQGDQMSKLLARHAPDDPPWVIRAQREEKNKGKK
ncbi:MAG: PulJ/GspJ family protein, partial [Planctomycetota bacterium]